MVERVVHKFVMPPPGQTQKTYMPYSWKPLHVAAQGEHICLWAEVTKGEAAYCPVEFTTVGTGHSIPKGSRWLGTVLHHPFVWHVYAEWTGLDEGIDD